MVAKCSICISQFKEPVCLPCGHLYCKTCLTEHVNVPSNRGMTSTCPDCRAIFHIAIPDLTYLPQKYHPFISHAVRRVYVDLKADANLQKKLKEAEDRLAIKKRGEEALLKRCESLKSSLEAHRLGEHEAMERTTEVEEKLEEVENEYGSYVRETNDRISYLTQENIDLQLNEGNLLARIQDLTRRLDYEKQRVLALEREAYARPDNRPYSDEEHDPRLHTPRHQSRDITRERVIKPLPKRVSRGREDDTIVVCPKRARMYSQFPSPFQSS